MLRRPKSKISDNEGGAEGGDMDLDGDGSEGSMLTGDEDANEGYSNFLSSSPAGRMGPE
jgi:hypothetical protein